MSFFNDPEFQTASNYFKFENPGDTITGEIVGLSKTTFPGDTKPQPQISLMVAGDTEPTTVTAGQVQLKTKLAELEPGIGDVLTITHTEVERRPGGKTLKHFDVSISPAGGASVSAPAGDATTAPSGEPSTPAGLTDEQAAALRSLGKL